MSWYYSENGAQAGPVTEGDLRSLVQSGRVTEQTLVWREGMAQWLPYQEARALGENPGASHQVCVECGRTFATSEMVLIGSHWVCAADKSLHLQKVREGVVPTGSFVYAGFWIRVVAKLIDGLILGVVSTVLNLGVFALLGNEPTAAIINFIINLVVQFGYGIYFNGRWGATLGKMALRLQIVRPSGEPLTYARAFGRSMAEIVSGIIFGIGYLIAAFDGEKRALHDHMCDTRVIRR